ncbi:hypothetical protein AA13595_2814 [Gluconacetobacter johannae DSM 13595]|nr:hypothetical protein AA13595_2814 [Gluconacetobacter johannae DSM 13595]
MPGPASTLPVAVILNRFLTDDLVFILGIFVSFIYRLRPHRGTQAAVTAGHAHSRPGRANRGLAIDKARGAIKPLAARIAPRRATRWKIAPNRPICAP